MNAMVGIALAPPTARDFDIHRMSQVEWASTRAIAAKHGISQTRVRQVVLRTCAWLAQALPVMSELELEQQVRLAQNLAADQLRHQAQQLANFWNGSGDPKYLRQQARVIQAMARLGVVPGRIEALAAEVTEGPEPLDEPQPAWSEEDAFVNSQRPVNGEREGRSDGGRERRAAAAPVPATFPLDGACSPNGNGAVNPSAGAMSENGASDCGEQTSEAAATVSPDELEGARIMERRLLTLIDYCDPGDAERRGQLQATLAKVRREKAEMELRLTPDRPGAQVAKKPSGSNQSGSQAPHGNPRFEAPFRVPLLEAELPDLRSQAELGTESVT